MNAGLSHRLRQLRLPVLVALVLNGVLVLTALRPFERTRPARTAAPVDDTPELLRFSRRQAREPALALLPLPSLRGLPPPPPSELPARRPGGAAGRRLGDQARPARPRSKAAAADAATVTATVTAAAADAQGTPQHRPPDETMAERPATARMLALTLQARALKAAEATVVAALWEQATPTRESPAGLAGPAEGVEQRRLPLARVRGGGLPLTDPLAVWSDGRVLLLWPDGDTLWMLGAADDGRTGSVKP
ncbi:MAG: hypothetical protein QUV07_12465 [Cyanobium sp. CZS 25K]|nr:hypothetical protein [Cyanobium sp. CZS25K]